MLNHRPDIASLSALIATIAVTGVHHVFRLGPLLIVPVSIGFVLPVVLWIQYRRTASRGLFAAYAVYSALIVFWFGFLDGFLDHAMKAMGLEKTTFHPGSEASVIATAFTLWSQDATTAFYEGTGLLSAVLALVTLITTAAYAHRELGPRRGVNASSGKERSRLAS